MKFIHFADYHLGVESSGKLDNATGLNSRVMDYLDILDSLCDFSDQEQVDLVLFAGDAFHRSNPSPTYMVEFSKRIMRLAGICPVVLLVGNHDTPGSLDKASAIDVYDTLSLSNVIVGKDYEVIELDLNGEKIEIATFPYPFRSKVLGNKQSSPFDAAVKGWCYRTILGLANQMSEDSTRLFLGHLTVDNCIFSSERMYMACNDSHVDVNYFTDFDYVALGHIHLHQVLNYNPPVIYAGSLERVDFGEEHDKKGFIFGEAHGHDVTWEFVEVDARPYTTLTYDYRENMPKRPTSSIVEDIESLELIGNIVRIIIHIQSELTSKIHIEPITKALEVAGVDSIRGISILRSYDTRDTVKDIEEAAGKPLVSMAPIQLLNVYLSVKGIDTPEKTSLLKLAKDIISEVNDG